MNKGNLNSCRFPLFDKKAGLNMQNRIFLKIPDWHLMAITAYGEARGEGRKGMHAVINVLQNRALLKRRFVLRTPASREIYRKTKSPIHAVILDPGQFCIFNIGDPNRRIMERLASRIEFNREVKRNSQLRIARDLAIKNKRGQLKDITNGADHFFSARIRPPAWARVYEFAGRIRNHLFYKTGLLTREIIEKARRLRERAAEKFERIIKDPIEEKIKKITRDPKKIIISLIILIAIIIFIILMMEKIKSR